MGEENETPTTTRKASRQIVIVQAEESRFASFCSCCLFLRIEYCKKDFNFVTMNVQTRIPIIDASIGLALPVELSDPKSSKPLVQLCAPLFLCGSGGNSFRQGQAASPN
uniref:Uncharacterized protein n=1 Tax=Spongospora subterranea TaxID=70186 RepID=A0A0H5QNB0_9EUKA|eukprot:CRZ03052.1 hypothetical protein [Spongospora subterranea]